MASANGLLCRFSDFRGVQMEAWTGERLGVWGMVGVGFFLGVGAIVRVVILEGEGDGDFVKGGGVRSCCLYVGDDGDEEGTVIFFF